MTPGGQAPSPAVAQDVSELVSVMRALKEHSGLSLRQLGERAAERGDVLPRSTLADVLNRSTLPRPELLAAFVRACGGSEEDVREWLAARDRVAAPRPAQERPAHGPVPRQSTEQWAPGQPSEQQSTPPQQAGQQRTPRRPRRRRGLLLGATAAGVVALGSLGAWIWRPEEPESAAESVSLPFPDAQVLIHPADAPELCLTEGHERSGGYDAPVAVQGPCEGPEQPDAYLRAVGLDDWYFVEWYKPSEGTGCLTLIDAGPASGLFEPVDRNECTPERTTQHFRLEPVTGEDAAQPAYRFRHAWSDQCLAFADDGEAPGAEAVLRSCDGESAESFLVERVS